MRICPTCGEAYHDQIATCATDGASLVPWRTMEMRAHPGAATRAMRPASAEDAAGEGPAPPAVGAAGALPSVALHSTMAAPAGPAAPAGSQLDLSDIHPHVTAPTLPAENLSSAGDSAGRVLKKRYTLKAVLGVGGFGAVFEAEDGHLAKRVAVKLLSPQLTQTKDMLARFRHEAITASQIGHEGIVDVTDFDRDEDGTNFIVMEYLDGCDLAAAINQAKTLGMVRALTIAVQIANALAAAHRKKIVHRDLKPANVYLVQRDHRPDFVKVIDFGISKMIAQTTPGSTLTSKGLIVGTPRYMAPEQARASPELDGRVDVYALGLIVYEMLTGRVPFEAPSSHEVLAMHLRDAPKPPSELRPELAEVPQIDAMILRALAKDPKDRFPTMEAFGHELLAALAAVDPDEAKLVRPPRSEPISARQSQPVRTDAVTGGTAGELSEPPRRSRRGLRWQLAALGLAAGVGVVFLIRATRHHASPASVADAPPQAAPTAPTGAGATPVGVGSAPVSAGAAAAPVAAGAAAAPVAAGSAAAPVAASPAALPPAVIHLTSAIAGVELFSKDGARLGVLPYELARPAAGASVEVTARAPGRRDGHFKLDADSPDSVDFKLSPSGHPKGQGGGDHGITRKW